MGFVAAHGLDTAQRIHANQALLEQVRASNVRWLRIGLVDQHGLVRCKVLHADQLASVLRNGLRMVNTLLLKDTACKTAWPVFTPGAGLQDSRLEGAADLVLLPEPETFRVLPWVPDTGWLLCSAYLPDGSVCPFDTRALLKRLMQQAKATRGWSFHTGLEVEFHVYRLVDPNMAPAQAGWPGEPPEVAHLDGGYQMLSELRTDMQEPHLAALSDAVLAMGMPLTSVEAEMGPSQCEFVFNVQEALASADAMVLLRSAAKQMMRRAGLHATFMCKPDLPEAMASGWHLHQSVCDAQGRNLFIPQASGASPLSTLGMQFLGGLRDHTPGCAAFASPTLNGYRRYAKANALAPNRVVWGIDNRGAVLRVIGAPDDPASRIEHRLGEPAANPYLVMASQWIAGLDGVDRRLDPGPANSDPYAESDGAPLLPQSLGQALDALHADAELREGLGSELITWYTRIKRQEIQRSDGSQAWEQREYFSHY
jgi:glutamine synthetase